MVIGKANPAGSWSIGRWLWMAAGLAAVVCFNAVRAEPPSQLPGAAAVKEAKPQAAMPPSPQAQGAEGEFFEKEVRPLLAQRCYECHGGKKKIEASLKLTSRADILHGGDDGPAIIPGKPDESLLIKAVRYTGDIQMPPKGKLKEGEIRALTRWVEIGAPWADAVASASPASGFPLAPASSGSSPSGSHPYKITDEQRRYWAFQPVRAVAPPRVKEPWIPRTDIDRFILARLEAKGLSLAPPADKRMLLRRATFDLTGLPPTPEEIAAFLADDRPEAFARVVDRLLASSEYGKRWGRHWLDLVRYADLIDARQVGKDSPLEINDAWRYRDWVVDAFNRDMPYDQFIVAQIAGDLLPAGSLLKKGTGTSPQRGVADAVNPPLGASPLFQQSGKSKEEVNAGGIIATGMLSLGIWDGGDADKEKMMTDIVDDQIDVVGRTLLGLTLGCARCHDHKFDPIPTADYYGLAGIFFSSHIIPDAGSKTVGTGRLFVPLIPAEEAKRRTEQAKLLADLKEQVKTAPKAQQADLLAAIEKLKAALVPAVPTAHGIEEGGVPESQYAGIHDAHILIRGSYTRPADVVPRHFPIILAGEHQPPIAKGSGRLELAHWIANPQNPLTARVMVNRIWQQHMGAGIVRTPSNFGKLGTPPTHPELLDYLAARFIESGWSIKAMHRAIMLSAVYQQSSFASAEAIEADPENLLFSRMNRGRLEAEEIRDAMLAVTGELDRKQGGPATVDFNDHRSTLYQMTIRSDHSNFRDLFDAANSNAIVDTRAVSTVAPQALFLMNNPFMMDRAKALLRRVEREAPSDDGAKIERLYVLLYNRPATAEEREIGRRAAREQGWEAYCQVLLCANEFICVD